MSEKDEESTEPEEQKVRQFLISLVDAPAKNIMGLADDWLKYFRYKNLLAIHDRVENLRKNRKSQGKFSPLPPKHSMPLLEASSLEESEEIQEIWARLIANATDPESSEEYHPSYVEVIKQLSLDEVLILQNLSTIEGYPIVFSRTSRSRSGSRWTAGSSGNSVSLTSSAFEEYTQELPLKNATRAMSYLNNLERLKLIEFYTNSSQLLRDKGYPFANIGVNMGSISLSGNESITEKVELETVLNEHLRFSEFGREFVSICISQHET